MHPLGQRRQVPAQLAKRVSCAFDDHEMAATQYRRIVVPVCDFRKGIAAEDEEELPRAYPIRASRCSVSEVYEGSDERSSRSLTRNPFLPEDASAAIANRW